MFGFSSALNVYLGSDEVYMSMYIYDLSNVSNLSNLSILSNLSNQSMKSINQPIYLSIYYLFIYYLINLSIWLIYLSD